MKQRLCQFIIILTAILLAYETGFSQTEYSLQDLAQKADQLSETIKIAQEDVQIAIQDKQRALSVLVPKVTTYGEVTEYKNDELASPDTQTLGIKLTQSFTLNGKELIAFDISKKRIQGTEFSLESVRAEYLLQVSQAYYNILSSQRFVEISQSDVERLQTHLNAVREKLNVGNVTKTDLYRAQAELSKSMTELVKSENGLLQSKASLKNLVDIDGAFTIAKEQIPGIENYDTTLEEIQNIALLNRNEIKEARKNLEIARQTVKFNKSDYWPTLSLEAGYKETDVDYETSSTDVRYDTEDLYFTGQISVPLFDGGLRRAQVKQALADEKKAKYALALQEKKVILDSKISFLEYTTAKSTLKSLRDELKSARENYNAVKMQFKYGMADSIDMMDANTLLVTAQRRISDARYTYYLSVLKILYTKGDLTNFLLASAQ